MAVPNPKKTLFETDLTDFELVDVEGVDALREDVSGLIYRWVKNRNATAMVAHEVVCYDADNVGSPALFRSVNDPITADLMLQAGINMAAAEASGSRCFYWIQVQGYHQDAKVVGVSGTAVAIGDELVAANGVGTLTRATAVGLAPKRRHTFIALETVSNATAATYSKDVYIACL